MSVLLLELQQPFVHVLEIVPLPWLRTRRPCLRILLHHVHQFPQRIPQRFLQERHRGRLSFNRTTRVPHHLERRPHALHQFLQCPRVNARGAAHRLPLLLLPLPRRVLYWWGVSKRIMQPLEVLVHLDVELVAFLVGEVGCRGDLFLFTRAVGDGRGAGVIDAEGDSCFGGGEGGTGRGVAAIRAPVGEASDLTKLAAVHMWKCQRILLDPTPPTRIRNELRALPIEPIFLEVRQCRLQMLGVLVVRDPSEGVLLSVPVRSDEVQDAAGMGLAGGFGEVGFELEGGAVGLDDFGGE
mmetsp:Transcript_24138/g.39203  ORF Transcript_24138/g.39203 Transcript_24138/m.39203 type:complete len:296 (-) Transcript_24138:283-1170(-)